MVFYAWFLNPIDYLLSTFYPSEHIPSLGQCFASLLIDLTWIIPEMAR